MGNNSSDRSEAVHLASIKRPTLALFSPFPDFPEKSFSVRRLCPKFRPSDRSHAPHRHAPQIDPLLLAVLSAAAP
jgi:hypothetical protein